jgi:hypothetical protein
MDIQELSEQKDNRMADSIYKVAFLLSYDYDLLKTSIPLVYDNADIIVLAKDIECRTWSGNHFVIDPDFYSWIKEIDKNKKIIIYEDNFYLPELNQLQNDTRERNMIAQFIGKGGWHIQLDADEYFVDFPDFIEYLKSKSSFLKEPEKKPVSICLDFHTLYKKLQDAYLYTTGVPQIYPVATNWPEYVACRDTRSIKIFSGFNMIHHSWARTEEEMSMKLSNWTHTADFDTRSYFNMWCAIDKSNYQYIQDFHPMIKGFWNKIKLIPAVSLEEVVDLFSKQYSSRPNNLLFRIKQNYFLKKYLRKG